MKESIKQCISNANDFFEIACDIDNRRFMFQYKYMSAFATNLSFSCELYFKAILMKERHKKIKDHKLSNLYNKLNDDTKELLKIEFDKNKGIHDLIETINNCDNVFIDFRYLYENDKNKKLYTTDLGNLAKSLRIICKNKFDFDIN